MRTDCIDNNAASAGAHPRTAPEHDAAAAMEQTDTGHEATASGSPGIQQGYLAGYVWYVIVLLSAVYVLSYMDRIALSVLMPFIKSDLDLSDGQLGFLIGFAFFISYAICGIPIARWADSGVRANIIATTLAIWSGMMLLAGAAQNFWHMLAARIGLGAGEAGCVPTSQSIIADYVPLERRAGIYSLYALGPVAGAMIGLGLAGWSGETIGWRWTFVALGVPGIALAVLVRLTLREPVRGFSDAMEHHDEGAIPLRVAFGLLWRCRTYKRLTMYLVVNGFLQIGLMQWWPSFYTRVFDLSPAAAGIYLGVAIGVGQTIGLLTGGFSANRAAQRDVRLPFKIGTVAISLALPAAVAMLFTTSVFGSLLFASLTQLLLCVPLGPASATLYSVTAPRVRTTGGAVTIFCISVLGFSFGPLCVGLLSDMLTPSYGTEALRYALLIPVVCVFPVLIAVLHGSAGRLAEDLKAACVRI